MLHPKIGPQIGPIPVTRLRVGKQRAPALHQADRRDDDDADSERKQAAPFAGRSTAEQAAREREQRMRAIPSKTVHEGGHREQAEAQRKNVEHRNARLHVQHLVAAGDQRAGDRRSLRGEQREAAQIGRDDRERPEQCRGIAPAQRVVAEARDRDRDQLLGQRRMHRIEHRLRHRRCQHLPRSRHVVHLVEDELLRRREADQQREMRDQENHDSNHCAPRHLRNCGQVERHLWGSFAWQICVTADKNKDRAFH
ncbi:hypothetical protein ACVWWR_005075 [Bradyrhizobium sp. LM3.2]